MSLYLGNTPLANTGYDKANTDLSNLTSTGKNIANWSNNVTNCITEIPQDIKLELNNGTLTLKAGSKVYVPNGAGVFDVKTINSDITVRSSVNAQIIVFYKSDNTIGATTLGGATSGTSQPTGTGYWYDTTNNIIKRIASGAVESSGHSFPLGILTCDSTQITSIDQVFNGFGYIGSTVFALPGVKGLIPNGRNADGSLKNIEWVASQVITSTLIFGAHCYYFGVYNNNQELAFYGKIVTKYDEKSNTIIDTYPDPDVIRPGWSLFGECIGDSNNKITSFTPKTAFHAVDYNDSSTISGWSMPSSRYIDLTLGASGATYIAPANGWAVCRIKASSANLCFCEILNKSNLQSVISNCYTATHIVESFVPLKKGSVYAVNYANGTPEIFRFIYAEGEN